MSSVVAVTRNLMLRGRIASFHPLKDGVLNEIREEFEKILLEMSKKHNFIIFMTEATENGHREG